MSILGRFKPGSVVWLFAHEVRMFFYEMGESKKDGTAKRGMATSSKILLGIAFLTVHLIVWGVMRKMPDLSGQLPAPVLMVAGMAMMLIFSLMLSLALNRSVKALFERGDLDLLLASPLPSSVIFKIRLAGITFGVALLSLLLLAPIAHVGLLMGQARWLGIYPTVLSCAVIASALAMLATLGLVKLIGVRRTRVAAQILAAFTGAGFFILTQVFANASTAFKTKIVALVSPLFQTGAILSADSWIWFPAHALFGAPLELAVFSGLALLCFYLATAHTHQFFVRGVQQSGTIHASKAPANSGARFKFSTGIVRIVLRKEWRLIWRDPHLISQILLQLMYILPLFFVFFRNKAVMPSAATAMTMLASSLVGSLIWVIISAEDAPDLIASAPVKTSQVRFAKLMAAVLPVLALLSPALVWLAIHDFIIAFLMLCATLAAMASVSMIHLWLAKPGKRSDIKKRAQGSIAAGILEAVNNFSWAGVVYVGIVFGWWGLIPLALALGALGVARLLKVKS